MEVSVLVTGGCVKAEGSCEGCLASFSSQALKSICEDQRNSLSNNSKN